MNSNKIGKNIKNLRTKRKMSQAELAKALNISVGAIAMYETGARIPRDEIKVKIAKYFDTTVESIFLISFVTLSDKKGDYAKGFT